MKVYLVPITTTYSPENRIVNLIRNDSPVLLGWLGEPAWFSSIDWLPTWLGGNADVPDTSPLVVFGRPGVAVASVKWREFMLFLGEVRT